MGDSGNGRFGLNGGIFDGSADSIRYDHDINEALEAAENGTSMESLLPRSDQEALAVGRSVLTVARAVGSVLNAVTSASTIAAGDINRHGLRGALARGLRRAAASVEQPPKRTNSPQVPAAYHETVDQDQIDGLMDIMEAAADVGPRWKATEAATRWDDPRGDDGHAIFAEDVPNDRSYPRAPRPIVQPAARRRSFDPIPDFRAYPQSAGYQPFSSMRAPTPVPTNDEQLLDDEIDEADDDGLFEHEEKEVGPGQPLHDDVDDEIASRDLDRAEVP